MRRLYHSALARKSSGRASRLYLSQEQCEEEGGVYEDVRRFVSARRPYVKEHELDAEVREELQRPFSLTRPLALAPWCVLVRADVAHPRALIARACEVFRAFFAAISRFR